MTRTHAFALVLALGGCSGESDPQGFAELGVAVENEIGARSPVACEALPFLHGSRRLTEHVIDGAFTITIQSSPAEARLAFAEGPRTIAEDLVVSRGTLEGGYDEELTLTLAGGERYFVSVGSGCAP